MSLPATRNAGADKIAPITANEAAANAAAARMANRI
jgi:hypothetical protein